MSTFFKQRLGNHARELFRYLRYMFNDYFMLALIFFIGGAGYYYSNTLKTLQPNHTWQPLLILIVLVFGIQLGRFATLVKRPDYVFLIPREGQMYSYLSRAFQYSAIMASGIQLIITVILLPIIELSLSFNSLEIISFLILMATLKISWLDYDYISSFQVQDKWYLSKVMIRWIIPVIVLGISIYLNVYIGLAVSIVVCVLLAFKKNTAKYNPLNWRKIIDTEESRMHGIYQFFNLFTDVPMISGSIKRRKFLDLILNKIKLIPQNTYLYLYSHGIIRDNEMSGLYRRLTIIGGILLLLVTGKILPIILCLLFIYLIGFQLIPFYFHFYDNVFVHIYPINQKNQIKSFQTVIGWMLITTAIIFGIIVGIANYKNVNTILGVVFGEAIELFIFLKIYLPRRIKKSEFNR